MLITPAMGKVGTGEPLVIAVSQSNPTGELQVNWGMPQKSCVVFLKECYPKLSFVTLPTWVPVHTYFKN